MNFHRRIRYAGLLTIAFATLSLMPTDKAEACGIPNCYVRYCLEETCPSYTPEQLNDKCRQYLDFFCPYLCGWNCSDAPSVVWANGCGDYAAVITCNFRKLSEGGCL